MDFANPFDAALAQGGAPAIFVLNDEGAWKLAHMLTRDAWERQGSAERDPCFALVRDSATGFVSLWYSTGRALLEGHPRAELRFFEDGAAAAEALAALGRPPVVKESWVMPS
ncbi:MAG: hypothetical protein H6741_02085 [Alphaproteobacteria bacterium]|nr:hypothetical protein [Alphaproteobacteria bacterium]MCB9791492.1 hypothetical protein [Alphaproteobacteria bacterium]